MGRSTRYHQSGTFPSRDPGLESNDLAAIEEQQEESNVVQSLDSVKNRRADPFGIGLPQALR